MNKEFPKLPLLSYHFVKSLQIFNSDEAYFVFNFLLNVHTELIKRYETPIIPLNFEHIAFESGVKIESMQTCLDQLVKMRFIAITSFGIILDIPTIVGVHLAFENLGIRISVIKKFRKALNADDYDTLCEMGFEEGGNLPWLINQ